MNIVVCASGLGGNFQALIDNQSLGYKITLLIVDRQCGAIERAINHNIPYIKINKSQLEETIPNNTNLVILAGYIPIVSSSCCDKWTIINTHPSLLPKYGGKGMIGVKVQEAVMLAKEKYAGCTIHYVNKDIDGGEIILQKVIEVDYNESPWELGGRIFKEENKLLIEAIKIIGGL